MHAAQQPADGGLVEGALRGHEADAASVVQPRLPLDERELEVAEVRHGEDGAAGGGDVLEARGRVRRAQRRRTWFDRCRWPWSRWVRWSAASCAQR